VLDDTASRSITPYVDRSYREAARRRLADGEEAEPVSVPSRWPMFGECAGRTRTRVKTARHRCRPRASPPVMAPPGWRRQQAGIIDCCFTRLAVLAKRGDRTLAPRRPHPPRLQHHGLDPRQPRPRCLTPAARDADRAERSVIELALGEYDPGSTSIGRASGGMGPTRRLIVELKRRRRGTGVARARSGSARDQVGAGGGI
jgi:hypothetical protein